MAAPDLRADVGDVVTFPRDAVVTIDQVAAALRVSPSTVRRMDLPTVYVGRQPRFVWGKVLDTLTERSR